MTTMVGRAVPQVRVQVRPRVTALMDRAGPVPGRRGLWNFPLILVR